MKKQSNWRKLLVEPGLSLVDAVKRLDEGAKRILIVVDKHDRLIGTVTDGDIRRALIRQTELTTPISEIMNTNPKSATHAWSRLRLLSFMERTDLLQLPIVDEKNKVVGVTFLYELLKKPRIDNPVCLMAGGFGTRLKPLTDSCPKPMLTVGDKPILEIILERFIEAGFWRFYISTHYMANTIKGYFGNGSDRDVEINYLDEREPLGTGGALSLLPREEINAPLILMNGDLLTNLDFLSLLSHHELSQSKLTMCLREYEQQVPFGVVNTQKGEVKSIVEKPVNRYHVNAGIYVMEPSVIAGLEKNQYVDMPTVVDRLLKQRASIGYYEVSEDWLDIGRLDDFKKAQQFVLESFSEL
ncbi:alcohol dehydrogenase [Alteromonas mediterranea]|uniref:nucleotidyltransferase family protein n=1 Tax=Alteromonas mediterranea TaxID=314275 RepID=UPI0009043E53|nr:nucleotidyltransferase family protein [Alteromonas mediterranea]APD93341.1 alcohol dehydrogenase [Alteromonas mediterranea]APD96965.1 alcohol dehydrogenase [Alteromonas mediterranea]MBR9783194.1 CBS domain-containing protein [Gammaproteobacteria bacterium]QGX61035.1 CBS domain-containing protein [Alteromonas mediterranea]